MVPVCADAKKDALGGHSETLAIACGLIYTTERAPIHVVNNLLLCDNSHAITAFVSKVEQRTILFRDRYHIHVFKDGLCSCGSNS